MTNPMEDNENTTALKRALFALKDMRAKLDAVERAKTEPIAIIGMGCRFPGGANTPEAYWKILNEEIDVIREVPPERWNIDEFYDPDPNAPGKMYVRKSGFIDNVDRFEPQFFGISPREVTSMDPQQRILLEVAWEAIENAGIVPEALAGSQTGVFIGMSTNDYSGLQVKHGDLANFDAYVGTGTSFSVAAGRIAYVLGLHGPTLTMDTACSSALVAVHLACQSLRTGQASMALAGGVSLILAPEGTVSMSKSHALAPDGYSKTFDAAADGYARGEGCGVIILKRLSDAVAAGDNILALIRGSAINHDGRSSGLTVPNGQAQQAVVRSALEDAGGMDPLQVHFVETHGTGTQLGDPIEVRALAAALGKDRPKDQPLVLASVKANIGHLEAAAGMAGLIKVVLAFQNEKIPAQVHFREPNPNIDWASISVRVAGKDEVWPKGNEPRIAGVNAFGFSGTNAHIVLEEAPAFPSEIVAAETSQYLLTLSAIDPHALVELTNRYSEYFVSHPNVSLNDVIFTANTRRTQFTHRLAVIGNSKEQLVNKLAAYKNKQDITGILTGQVGLAEEKKIAFLFTGQGAQYIDMGRQLYESEPVFRTALEKCDELLRPYLEKSLLTIIFPKPGEESPINETAYTQPALFAIEYALAELWRSWGITPSAVMGHSVGEYVAACVAGLFSLEDGLKLIAERGRLMQSLPRDGAMAAVFADHQRVTQAIAPFANDVSIAAINGPENIVISGRETALQAILQNLAQAGIKASRLSVSHAFHSPLMDTILDAFEQTAGSITFTKPRIPLTSNVTGKVIAFEEISQPSYWRKHIRQPVQFQSAMETLQEQGYRVFLEIGPQPTLLGMAQRCISGRDYLWLASLRQQKEDSYQMLESLGALYVHGIDVDWQGFHQHDSGHVVPLPSYPFQRQRYWFETRKKAERLDQEMIHPLLGHKVRSPLWKGTAYETQLSVEFPAFLNNHRIYETAIFPGAGYMEMALAAAKYTFGQNCSLADVVIREALVLPEDGQRTVQITISVVQAGKASFDVYSLDQETQSLEENWKHHGSGSILLENVPDMQVDSTSIDQLKTTCSTQINVSDFYQGLADLGIEYGPSFQGLSQIWQGENQALGQINLSKLDAAETHKYQLHPALLDACFQLLGAATPPAQRDNSDKIYVPVGLRKLTVFQSGQHQVWAHVSFSSPVTRDDGSLKDVLDGNIKLFAMDGTLAAEVNGLQIQQISRLSILPSMQRNVENWLYEIRWQTASKPDLDTSIRNWLIFADEGGTGDQLAEQLTARGLAVTRVKPGAEIEQTDGNNWKLDPRRPEHIQTLISEFGKSLNGIRPGIVHLWSMDPSGEHQRRVCESILYLVQALAERSISPAKISLVTEAVHTVASGDEPRGWEQSSVWGLARTIATEYPNWKCACVDLAADSKDYLFEEILRTDDENQIALRGEERYVARLERTQADTDKLDLPKEPFELVIPTPGVLDALILQKVGRQAPGAGEVEIQVEATGLNFRDVLNALGMYPGAQIPLGIECAGTIVAVGEDVTEFKVGEEVIGLTTRAFRSYATIPLERVFAKPKQLSPAQAASIPTTFLTASYGLHHLAGMKAGDRVLIHAAAGGVGLAAVQLAQRAGAEVFGTAGSPQKRAYLRSLGVQHVFDSRTLDFAEQIMQVTAGKGVDIVLNSLADDFIPKSISVLADGGCFLEMGKRDDWDQAKVLQLNPSLKYHRYDLGTEMVNDMPFIRSMLDEMLTDFEKGIFTPLPLRTFPMQSVREAFRYMAQARHIGKIVITQGEATITVHKEGTYLITGGLGGLGLVTTRWLAERGARHIVLVSRNEPSVSVGEILDEIRSTGAEIITMQGDVSCREDVAGILQNIQNRMPPLRGLFHEAGVLDDGILTQQTWSRFERVMQPKAGGALNLHELTQNIPLDFFLLFSSAAAVLGSAGQANYAAANSLLDGLAHFRQGRGLPAMSVNWGPWSEVGMAAQVDNRKRSSAPEANKIHPQEGMKVLEHLLQKQPVQAVILPTNWNKLRLGDKPVQPLLRQVVKSTSKTDVSESFRMDIDQIKTLPAEEQKTALERFAQVQVVKTLGLDPAQPFNALRPLTDLGMDSLMAVELKNKIEGDTGVNIPVPFLLESASVADLTRKILEQMGHGSMPNQMDNIDQRIDSEKAKQLLENLDQLSEDEVNSLLDNLLPKTEEL